MTEGGERARSALVRAFLPASVSARTPGRFRRCCTRRIAPPSRCRLAAALARAWVYGGYPERAVVFADEAAQLAGQVGDPAITADALDAALLARWGPDSFAQRRSLSARLAEVTAHLADAQPRLNAHRLRRAGPRGGHAQPRRRPGAPGGHIP